MYRFFLKNNAAGALGLLAVLVLLRLRLLTDPGYYVVADTPDLYTPFWQQAFGHVAAGSTLSAVLAVLAVALCALITNNTANRYGLTSQQTNLGGLFFVILSGAFRPAMGFQPVLIYCLALVWCIDRLFSATRKERPYLSVAWGFGIAALGCLFWAKGVWFLPLLFLLLPVLRLAAPRCLTAALLGVCSTAVLAAAALLYSADPAAAAADCLRAAVATLPFWRVGPVSITYLVVSFGLIALAAAAGFGRAADFKIASGRMLRAALWVVFYAVLLMLLPGFSYELQPIVAAGAALFMPRAAMAQRSPLAQEVPLLMLTAATAVLIYI